MSRYVLWEFGLLAAREGGWGGALRAVLDEHAADVTATAAELDSHLSGLPWDDPDTPHPDWSPDRWWTRHESAFAEAFAASGVSRRRADALAEHVRAAYCDPTAWSLRSGTEATLDAVGDRGWDHLLLTNSVPELPDLLEALGLADRFVATFGSARTGYEKPHPRAYEQVYEWGERGDRFWLVTDTERDREGARLAGIPSILVDRGGGQGESDDDRTVRRLREVPGLLPD